MASIRSRITETEVKRFSREIKLALLQKIMSKTTYENRKIKGLCVGCGKQQPIVGKVMCAECAEKQKIYQKETREYLRNIGLCPRCGKNKLFGDEKECPECCAMMYELNRKSRERRNLTSMDYYKKDIIRLKELGLCRSCRTRKASDGHTYCSICLAKRREQSKKYRRKNDEFYLERTERPQYGFCYTCGNQLDRDGRVCQKCADKMARNLPKQRDNLSWRNDNKLIFNN